MYIAAKSKHNASQKKEIPKQQQQQQQQQAQQSQPTPPPVPAPQKQVQSTLPVPATQPSKPTNKANKMRELNLKGASKEGTDMDAFNDNVTVAEDATNANHSNNTSSINTSEYINNSNNLMLNNNINISSSTVVNDSNKRIESNDVSTIKPPTEIKSLSKGKVDVTDIVKDVPKPIKPIVNPTQTPSQDEPDRSSLSNEKMVQAKNEANAKANAEVIDSNASDVRINLHYKDG